MAYNFVFLSWAFMVANGVLFGGEICVYPASGLLRADAHTGLHRLFEASWDLRRSWFMTEPQAGWRGRYQRSLARVTADDVTPRAGTPSGTARQASAA